MLCFVVIISQWTHPSPLNSSFLSRLSFLCLFVCVLPSSVLYPPFSGALDGFTSAKPATTVKPATTKATTSVTDENEDEGENGQLDDEFKNSLAAGMEELMKEMNGNSELQKSFEEMFKGLGVDGKAPVEAPASTAAPGESFQDRIAKTMGKLKESSDEVDVSFCWPWLCILLSFFFLFPKKTTISSVRDPLVTDSKKIKPRSRIEGIMFLRDHALFHDLLLFCYALNITGKTGRQKEDRSMTNGAMVAHAQQLNWKKKDCKGRTITATDRVPLLL